VDRCCELIGPELGEDLRALLTPAVAPAVAKDLSPDIADPALFVVEYALSQLLASWRIHPRALIGQGIGGYVAGCLAGVFSLEDALRSLARLTQLRQTSPTDSTRSITREFEAWLRREVALNPPELPYISEVTGAWATPEQATDPATWARCVCEPEPAAPGLNVLSEMPEAALLEVGPGHVFDTTIREYAASVDKRSPVVIPTLGSSSEGRSALETLLLAAGKLWACGVDIDWNGLSAGELRRRVPLPTYVFERQSFWIDSVQTNGEGSTCVDGNAAERGLAQDPVTALAELPRQAPSEWFYLPGWKQSAPVPQYSAPAGQYCWLFFDDDAGISQQVSARLKSQGHDVVHVKPGAAFSQVGPNNYSINPGRQADYADLLQVLRADGKLPDRVGHFWMLGCDAAADEQQLLDLGFRSLMCLGQSLGALAPHRCSIQVVTDACQNVSGTDAVNPVKATIVGPCRVIPLEYPDLPCRAIDILLPEGATHAITDQLVSELNGGSYTETVALRGNRRWVPAYEHISIGNPEAAPTRIRPNGVYLITGGLGGLGHSIATYLAQTHQANLVLVSRSGLPPREEWPGFLDETADPTAAGRHIRQVIALEALGAQVLTVSADVSRIEDVQAAVDQALHRFGRLDGVIHAAGVPGAGLMQFKTPAHADTVLAPKVLGTLALERVLRDISLDFLVLFSSISSITGGGPGQVDYCAANAFLDAFAERGSPSHGLTVAINWSEWHWNAWDDALSGHDEAARTFLRENRRRVGITGDEGAQAFERVLALGLPRVVVATQDFPSMVHISRQLNVLTLLQTRRMRDNGRMHPRPSLPTAYVAPVSEVERKIATSWSQALGIANIGINDNFFDLGGNSLSGVDLIARLRQDLGTDRLAPHVLYEAPTVNALARLLETPDGAADVNGRQQRGQRRRTYVQQPRTRDERR
jgi:NAD(P)-dependent dehydrogenase (short-subunit alcohol dehydrogenase family)